jgi:hypothetical protein
MSISEYDDEEDVTWHLDASDQLVTARTELDTTMVAILKCEEHMSSLQSRVVYLKEVIGFETNDPRNIFNIRKYDFARLPLTGCIAILGSEKWTWYITHVLYKPRPILVVSDSSETQKERWSNVVGADVCDASVSSLQLIRDRRIALVRMYEEMNVPFPATKYITVVFEMDTSNPALLHSSIMHDICTNSGRLQMLIVFASGGKNPTMLPVQIRANCDVVILMSDAKLETSTTVRTHDFCRHILSQRQFNNIFLFATFNDRVFVIDNRTCSDDLRDIFFYGMSDLVTTLKRG